MLQPLITLTTDFGLAGHFAAAMKGVILRIEPRARIVDISHEITPFAVAEAAFALAQAYRYFPKGTIHVAVVDPGVGSPRRPILAQAAGHYFVAPDNGVLSMIFKKDKHTVRAITASRYFLKPVSATFHGRDVFAPVAARLARGVAPSRFGKRIADYVVAGPSRQGVVLAVDRFGNLITDLPVGEFPEVSVQVGKHRVTRRAASYADGAPGELLLLPGSSGFWEIALNQASAARLTGCTVGQVVNLLAE